MNRSCHIFSHICGSALLLTTSLSAAALPELSIKNIHAEELEFKENKLLMDGAVRLEYDMGSIRCNKAEIFFHDKKKSGGTEHFFIEKIDLLGQVEIELSDGSLLTAERGEIFCKTQEAIFYGSPEQKASYTFYSEEDGEKVPLVATGKKLIARIAKDSAGRSSLADIRGEGSISIECLRPEKQQPQ